MGSISIDGRGGNGLSDNYGVLIGKGNAVTTSTGAVRIIGTGGATGTVNHGIYMINSGAISSTGNNAADINITGNGGLANGAGVQIIGGSGRSSIRSSTGDIVINAQGGTVSGTGLRLGDHASDITSTGTTADAARIIINAGGTGNSDGLFIDGNGSATYISSQVGDIDITASGSGTGTGLRLARAAKGIESTGSANITLNLIKGAAGSTSMSNVGGAAMSGILTIKSDLLDLGLISLGTSSTGKIILKPYTASETIGLGGGAGTLNLTDAELANITAGTLIIGDSASGTGDVAVQSWDLSGKTHNVELYGNDIDLGGLTLGTGNFTAYAKKAGSDNASINLSAAINKSVAGASSLFLKADETVYLNAITATNGALNTYVWTDADNNGGDGQVSVTSAITTNGGNIYLTGGLDNGANGGTASDGIADNFMGESSIIGGTLNAGGGNILVNAKSVSGTYNGLFIGDGSQLTTTGAGSITLRGAQEGGSYTAGVSMTSSGAANTISVQNGTLNIIGTNSSAGNGGTGIFANSASILSTGTTGGNINIIGTRSTASDAYGFGVQFDGAAVQIGSVFGDIGINGTYTNTGTGNGASGAGVSLANGTIVSTSGTLGGNIALAGTSSVINGGGIGLDLSGDATRVSTTKGNIALTGQAAASGTGGTAAIRLNGSDVYSTTTGALTFNGTASGMYTSDLEIGGTTSYIGDTGSSGDMTFNVNNIALSGAAVRTSGTVLVKPRTISTSIGLGGGSGALNLDDTELAMFNAGTFIIGDSAAGTGDVAVQTWNMSGKAHNVELYGNDINLAGLTLGTGNFTAQAKNNGADLGDLTLSAAITKGVAGASSLSLRADNDIAGGSNNITATTGSLGINLAADYEADGNGAISLGTNSYTTNGGNITLSRPVTATGALAFNAGAGTFTADAISVGANNLSITADDAVLSGNLSGTGALTIQTGTDNRYMRLNYGAGDFNLSSTELGYLVNGWSGITMGRATSYRDIYIGDTTWLDPVTFRVGTRVSSYNTITSADNAPITFNVGWIDARGTINSANNLTFNTSNSLGYTSYGSAVSAAGNVAFNGNVGLGSGTLSVSANSGTASVTGTVDGARDLTIGASTILLGSAVGGTTALRDVSLTSANAITLPSITARSILARTTGATSDLTLANGTALTASGTGDALVLASGRNFINNSNGSALSASSGRWLVYSKNPAYNARGGLMPNAAAIYGQTYAANAPATIAAGNRFLFSNAAGTAPVLTFTADDKSRTYGALDPAFTYTVSGYLTGDNAGSAFSGAPSLSTLLTQQTSTGVYTDGIDITLGTLGGYLGYGFAFDDGDLTIGKANLTIIADDKSKTYGAVNPALTASYSGLMGWDTSAAVSGLSIATAATQQTGVGIYDIVASGGTSANYNLSYVDGDLTIGKASLTITADDKSKTYGAVNPALTASYSGLMGWDTSAAVSGLSVSTAATQQTGAGTYDIVASGGSAANYNLSYVDGDLTIGKANLTVTADDKSKTYGAVNPALTASYSGLMGWDTAAAVSGLSVSTAATQQTGAGTYDIVASGGSAANYNLSYVDGDLTIGKANLTVTADDKSKTYGAVNPALTASYSGLMGWDTAAAVSGLSVSTAATQQTGAGTYDIVASGGSAANYNLSYVDGDLTIGKANLTVTADDKSKTYGAVNPALTASYSGLMGWDTAAAVSGLSVSTAATQQTGAGTYDIVASGGSAANYNLSYVDGDLTIGKANLTVTADDKSKTYGAVNPALTASYSGLMGWDTAAAVSGLSVSTAATQQTGAGIYDIVASGGTSANYNLNYVDGDLTIGKANLTITADDKSKTYGAVNPALTASYSGLMGWDTAAAVSGLSVSTAATQQTGAGTYDIVASGGSAANYNLSYVDGDLTIGKANLTVTADDKSKTYGAVNPALTASYSGLMGWDTAAAVSGLSVSTAATQQTGAGIYDIVASGGTSANYNLNYVDGDLTIGKANLTITADDKSKTYGAVNPALTASYSGLMGWDTSAAVSGLSVATAATQQTGAGIYDIVASGGTSANYNLSYVDGDLTIDKANLTIVADDKSKTYGSVNPALTASYSGLMGWDTSAAVSGLSVATAATQQTGVGIYDIVASGATAANYNLSYVDGDLTIGKANLTITADNKTKMYGSANPAFTATYTGLMGWDTASAVSGLTLSSPATTGSVSGSYAIQASGGSAANYTLSYVDGILNIGGGYLVITVDSAHRNQFAADPVFNVTYSGFLSGDTASVVSGLTFTTTAARNSMPGRYSIMASGATASGYIISYANGELIVDAPLLPETVAMTIQQPLFLQNASIPANIGEIQLAGASTVDMGKAQDSAGDRVLIPDLVSMSPSLLKILQIE